ncbi:hypothetical protein ZWY2020_034500, partial [Hordeum vulgare]
INHDKPSDDPSNIRGEILSSGDPWTLPLTYILKGTQRHSGMNLDPSGGDNHSSPGRGGDTSLS